MLNLAFKTFKDKNSNVVKYAAEFDKDIERLHPLSKLKGIGANKDSRSKLPNLANTTDEFAEDLLYAIEEIFEPSQEVQNCDSWCNSRLRVLAVA